MPREQEKFCCPFCGMHAPKERLTEEGPFELAQFRKVLGGKTKLTPEEREDQKKKGYRRLFVPGNLDYTKIEISEEVREAAARRKDEIEVFVSGGSSTRGKERAKEAMSPADLAASWKEKPKNIGRLQTQLDNLKEIWEETNYTGYEDVEQAIDEYQNNIERGDYDSQEEYQEARDEAWEDILEKISEMEIEI